MRSRVWLVDHTCRCVVYVHVCVCTSTPLFLHHILGFTEYYAPGSAKSITIYMREIHASVSFSVIPINMFRSSRIYSILHVVACTQSLQEVS